MDNRCDRRFKQHASIDYAKSLAERAPDAEGGQDEGRISRSREGNAKRPLPADGFPAGTRFYDWHTLPLAAVPDGDGPRFFNYSFDPPHQLASMAGLHAAREVCRETFEALRTAQRLLSTR